MAKSNPNIPTVNIVLQDPVTSLVVQGIVEGTPPSGATYAGIFSLECLLTDINGAGIYEQTGSVAVPAWTLLGAGALGMTQLTGDVTAGPGAGSQVASIAAGVIVNADVNAAAAIDYSKLATLTSGNILVGSVGNVATSVAMSGDATIVASGALTIANSAITNAKVDAAAAIDFSKLATLTSGNILVGSAGNVATSVAASGDATISNAGVVTVVGATGAFEAGGAITNAGGTLAVGFISTAAPQALSGPGAVNITSYQTQFTSTGTGDGLTLASATRIGHLKKVSYIAEGAGADTGVITPVAGTGFTTATLNAIGDYIVFMWDGAGWLPIEYVGVTLA